MSYVGREIVRAGEMSEEYVRGRNVQSENVLHSLFDGSFTLLVSLHRLTRIIGIITSHLGPLSLLPSVGR